MSVQKYSVEQQSPITKVLVKTDLIDVKISQDENLSWSLEHHCLMKGVQDQNCILFEIASKEQCHAEFVLKLPAELEEIRVETESGDIEIEAIKADYFKLHSKSGDVKAEDAEGLLWVKTFSGDIEVESCVSDQILLNSTSGDIDVKINEAKEISIKSTSGEIEVDIVNAGCCTLGSTSGDIEFAGSADHLRITSKSGDVEADCFMPKAIQIETLSGDVELSVQDCKGLEGVVQSESGKMEVDLEDAVFLNSTLSWKDGGAKVSITTSSGDVSLSEE